MLSILSVPFTYQGGRTCRPAGRIWVHLSQISQTHSTNMVDTFSEDAHPTFHLVGLEILSSGFLADLCAARFVKIRWLGEMRTSCSHTTEPRQPIAATYPSMLICEVHWHRVGCLECNREAGVAHPSGVMLGSSQGRLRTPNFS